MRGSWFWVPWAVTVLMLSGCSAASGRDEAATFEVTVPAVASDGGSEEDAAVTALLEQAKAADPVRYQFALDAGAEITATTDGASFVISWFPAGTGTAKPAVIATIHGHGSWAFNEFFLWHRFAAERGYGIVALQWWDGDGELSEDYYSPSEVQREFVRVFEREGVAPGTVLFHGFSRGAANSYAVVARDATEGPGYYLLAVANAGKPSPSYPPNIEIREGVLGPQPLKGTNWVTFCGELDPNPSRDGCPGMREAATWIERFGGTVMKAIEDPAADHGGFHKTAAHVNAALDVFAGLLAANER